MNQILKYQSLQKFYRSSSTSSSPSLPSKSLPQFIAYLNDHNIHRAYVIRHPATGAIHCSSPHLQSLASFITTDKIDYLNHEAIFLQRCPVSNSLFSAFVHSTVRGQACGGIRMWSHATVEAFMRDGLRLAIGMGRKSALAGLWWGGGKGVVYPNPSYDISNLQQRHLLFQSYGKFLSSLRGVYVAAEDVGLNTPDLDSVLTTSRFTTCIDEDKGGSGNPSAATAKGVICAMEAALHWLKQGDLEGKVILMQGAGNVGTAMIDYLLTKNIKYIYATDINMSRINYLKSHFKSSLSKVQFRYVPGSDESFLHHADANILVPNALGGIINTHSINEIKKTFPSGVIICGAANSQLLNPLNDDAIMHNDQIYDATLGKKRPRITYVPDFVANRMGITQCANEQYGSPGADRDPSITRHFQSSYSHAIYPTVLNVLNHSVEHNIGTHVAACKRADLEIQQPHPIWGNRVHCILQSLIDDEWHLKKIQ